MFRLNILRDEFDTDIAEIVIASPSPSFLSNFVLSLSLSSPSPFLTLFVSLSDDQKVASEENPERGSGTVK